jgi:hypothetical protein
MAISFVGGASAVSSSGSTVAVTYSPTAGNTVIVLVSCTSTQSVSGVVDNATGGSSTYTQQVTVANGCDVEIWSTTVNGAKAGATTITATVTGSTQKPVACVVEYSGVTNFGNTANNTGATTPLTVTITAQDNNSVLIAGYGQKYSGTFTQITGNLREKSGPSSNGNVNCAIVEDAVVAAGSAVISLHGTTVNYGAVALELLQAAATGPNNQLMMTGAGT